MDISNKNDAVTIHYLPIVNFEVLCKNSFEYMSNRSGDNTRPWFGKVWRHHTFASAPSIPTDVFYS